MNKLIMFISIVMGTAIFGLCGGIMIMIGLGYDARFWLWFRGEDE